jgi:hypothetical protein
MVPLDDDARAMAFSPRGVGRRLWLLRGRSRARDDAGIGVSDSDGRHDPPPDLF